MQANVQGRSKLSFGTWVYVLGVLWVLWALAGVYWLTEYSAQPGQAADAPQSWPEGIPFQRSEDKFTLVMLVHPHCPCSRSSIGELAELMTDASQQLDVHVFFLRPSGVEENWGQTDLWRSAARIPGVQVHEDPSGRNSKSLGAKTSGQAVLFDRAGRLAFAGGITPGRGHMGESQGSRSILAAIQSQEKSEAQAAVYGCDLFDPENQ